MSKIPDSQALPVGQSKRRKKRATQAATQEERDAIRFAAIKARFDWSNEEWAETWLPWIRLAAALLETDDVKLKEIFAAHVKEGEAPNILEGWTRTKAHMLGLANLADVAMGRAFLVLERLGYSPDNLPPEQPVH